MYLGSLSRSCDEIMYESAVIRISYYILLAHTVGILLDKLHIQHLIAKKAVLLVVRPLKIGSKDVSSQFVEYKHPSG